MTDKKFKELLEAYDNYFMSLYLDITNPQPQDHDSFIEGIQRKDQSDQKLHFQLRQQYRQR